MCCQARSADLLKALGPSKVWVWHLLQLLVFSLGHVVAYEGDLYAQRDTFWAVRHGIGPSCAAQTDLVFPIAWERLLQVILPMLSSLLDLLAIVIVHPNDEVKHVKVLRLQWS